MALYIEIIHYVRMNDFSKAHPTETPENMNTNSAERALVFTVDNPDARIEVCCSTTSGLMMARVQKHRKAFH